MAVKLTRKNVGGRGEIHNYQWEISTGDLSNWTKRKMPQKMEKKKRSP